MMVTQYKLSLLIALLAAILLTSPLPAAIIVDPDGTGATDVGPTDPSTWNSETTVYIGNTTFGELLVDDASQLDSYWSYIGFKHSSTGIVAVNGSGSTWTSSGNLHIGYYGSGILSVTNRGAIENYSGIIGYETNSIGTVKVDGLGSTWKNSSYFHVGFLGKGTLNVTGGGKLASTYSSIGYQFGSTGNVNINGNGSTWENSNDLYIGWYGDGTLNITDGGIVISNGYYSHIGRCSNSSGIVRVSGNDSTWTNSYDLLVGDSSSGTLRVSEGGLVSVGGTLTIDNDSDNNSFVNMTTGGMLALFGDADNSLGEFLDLINGTDAINYWDDVASDWADITGATYGDDYTLSYLTEGDLAGYTVLTVGTVPVAGDANGDGKVDGSDVTILAGNWQVGVDDGQTATWEMGDFNGDGQVDGSDVTILAGNWQTGVDEAAASVPEPSGVGLLLSALALLLAHFHRRR